VPTVIPSFTCLLTFSALTIASFSAYAQGMKGRPIEYNEPRTTEENTMLNPKQSRLGSLESELNRPFESLNPGRSLDGVMLNAPLPAPAPIVRNNSRDLSNKRLDWMYRSTEDLLSVDTVEGKYKRPELTSDGRDRNKMRPMERAYYDALDSSSGAQLNNQPGYNAFGSAGLGTPNYSGDPALGQSDLSGLPGGLRDALQRTLQNSRGFSTPNGSDATDFSSFNRDSGFQNKPTPAELRRAEQFMQIYNFSGNPSTTESPGYTTIRSSPYVNSSFYDLAKPQLSIPTPPVASSLSSPQFGGFTPPSPIAPVTLGSAYALPSPQPVRSATPSSPFLNVTRGGVQ